MNINIDDNVGRWIGSIVTVCSVIFAVFLFLDARHVDHQEAMVNDSKVRQRILVSESTRYAEVYKYYVDLQKERPLTQAEQLRMNLVEQEQKRITETLLESTEIDD